MFLNTKRFFIRFLPFLLYSCAIQVPPQGGSVDRTPPVLVTVTPPDQSTGFSATEIAFEFDENIQLKDLNNQLLISPPLKRQPVTKVRKNRLYLQLEDTLKANTTYCFNFGGAVADLNEGNAITDFTYVVSTGAVIDTLKLIGTVVKAEDLNPESGAVVALYDNFDDSIPYKEIPRYYGRTGKDGSFVIRNIAPGNYRIFGLQEKNGNYLFDDPSERIAFDTAVMTFPGQQDVRLSTFQRMQQPVFMKTIASIPGRIQAVFTAPSLADSIHWITGKEYLGLRSPLYGVRMDTIDFWYTRLEADTAAFAVFRGQKTDTVLLTLKKKSSSKNAALPITLSCGGSGYQAPNRPLSVLLPAPVTGVNSSLIRIVSDSAEQPFSIGSLGQDSLQFDLDVAWKEGGRYTVSFLPGAFTSIWGSTNDTLVQQFSIKERSDYGTLKVNLTGIPLGVQRILSVVDEKNNTVVETVVTADTVCFFEYLSPTRFRLKLIDDSNKNGKWDTGDDLLHRPPEQVHYYADPVPVRANWDVEIKWQVKQ